MANPKPKTTEPDTDYLPPAMDYRMHEGTYERFLVMVKWGTISVAILMVILYFLIIA